MAGLNKILLIGNLGRDPEMKHGQSSGKAVTRFSLAVGEKIGGEEKTEWFQVVCFDKLAEIANQYLRKGNQVFIEGRAALKTWDGRDGEKQSALEVVARNLTMLGGNRQGPADVSDDAPF